MTTQYTDQILDLIKTNIDPGVICHLTHMCKATTTIDTRDEEETMLVRYSEDNDSSEEKEEEEDTDDWKKPTAEEQSKMLCNVLVRATHELHFHQKKNRIDTQTFLKNDCKQLSTRQLVQKCEQLVAKDGEEIYKHVTSNVELSRVCDYIQDSDEQSVVPSIPSVQCDLCTFVLANAKRMLEAKHTGDKVLLYIDEQMCSRLTGAPQRACKKMVETNGEALLSDIHCGTQPMLLCAHFQVCLDQITDQTSPIQKMEMHSFLKNDICTKLGPLKDACEALLEKDGTRLMRTLANEVDGSDLCQIFGLCPQKMFFLDNLAVNDDKNKCKRCVDDFTRRKHIAEKLVNHSSQFLHHLCGQLPQKDECTKEVDESINELVNFIRSLDPQEICVQLNMCNQFTLTEISKTVIIPSDNLIHEEVITYIKTEICPRLDTLSPFCEKLVDVEGPAMLALISKEIDLKNACQMIGVCPRSSTFGNCEDKCECCMDKMEMHQTQAATILRSMVASTRLMCKRMPTSSVCVQLANKFESNVDKVIARFDSKHVCQLLSFCPVSKKDDHQKCKSNAEKCQCCKSRIDSRQTHFRSVVNEVTIGLVSMCKEDECRSFVRSTQQHILDKIEKINSQKLCDRLGYCILTLEDEPRSLRVHARLSANTLDNQGSSSEDIDRRIEKLLSRTLCFEYGHMKPLCEQLMASTQSRRYARVYMALLKKDTKLIDDDLREQLTSEVHADVCTGCKNAVQSSLTFWLKAVETVRSTLIRSCEHCPVKDQCVDWYNQRFDYVKSYLDSIDPEQWCQAIHLCSLSQLKVISSSKCSMCMSSLQSRKDALLHTVDRLTSYFDDICQRFIAKQCQTFVEQLGQSAREWLNDFDPKETCTSLGFCSTKEDTFTNMDFNKFERQLENELEKTVCATLGPLKELCNQVVRGNTKQIQTLKINYNIKDLMNLGEQWSQGGMLRNFFSAENLDKCTGDKCQCCINRVDTKKEWAKNLGDKITSAFIRTCDWCPAKDQCRNLWSNAQSRLDSYIDDIDSNQVCTRLGYCSVSSLCANMGVFRESCEQTLTTFTQSLERDRQTLERHLPHTSVVLLPRKTEEKLKIDDSNSTCILCEFVMNTLSNYIHQKSTQDQIERSLEKVCDDMPATLKSQCHELIDNYGPSMIATILNEFDVSTICRKLNLCSTQMHTATLYLSKADTGSCGICDYVSTYVHFALRRDPSDKTLQQALSTVCSHLSSEQMQKCQTLVHLFAPNIRQLQLNVGNNFCKQLTICQTPMSDLQQGVNIVRTPWIKESKPIERNEDWKRIVGQNIGATPECTLCHYVVSYLDAVLKNNQSKAAVEEALARVCAILPRKERVQCNVFVTSYGPVLAELIAEMADPDMVCRYLGMCQEVLPQDTMTKKSTPVTYPSHGYASWPTKTPPFTCTICQFVVTHMKEAVALNQTEQEILASMKDACKFFNPLQLKQQCLDFVDQYAPYLIQMISDDIEPKVVCQNLSLCPNKDQQLPPFRPLAGAPQPPATTYGKCIFGISYWCTSRQNAELCNAVEVCERQVWSKQNKNIVI